MAIKEARADVAQIRQTTQFTCCAASIAAALKAHGKDVTEDDVNKVLGAAPMAGATWEAMLATVQYFGLRGSLVVPSTPRMLKAWTDQGLPIVIAWNPENRPWSHASTVFDVKEGEDGKLTIYVMDPNIPNPSQTTRVLGEDEFCQKWGEKVSDSLIVRRPAMVIEREVTVTGRQVRASTRVAEAYDCLKDYRGGGLSREEYEDCLKRAEGLERRHFDSFSRYYKTWAEIAALTGRPKDAEFLQSIARYVGRRGGVSAKQGEALDRMEARYKSELIDPKATLLQLKSEAAEKARQEAVAAAEAAAAAKAETDHVRSLGRLDMSKWRINGIEPISYGGDTVALFNDGGYNATVFWFASYTPASDRVQYVIVEKGAEKVFQQSNLNLTPEEGMEFAQGVIAAHIQGEPIGKARTAPRPPPPAPTPPPRAVGVVPAQQAKMVAILDILIRKTNSAVIKGFKQDLEAGKILTEDQMKAIRHQLYKSGMKPDADHFRTATEIQADTAAEFTVERHSKGHMWPTPGEFILKRLPPNSRSWQVVMKQHDLDFINDWLKQWDVNTHDVIVDDEYLDRKYPVSEFRHIHATLLAARQAVIHQEFEMSKTAKKPQPVVDPKEESNTVRGPAPSRRDVLIQDMISHPGGTGGHHTRDRDVGTGRSRKEKHKKDWQSKESASRVTDRYLAEDES